MIIFGATTTVIILMALWVIYLVKIHKQIKVYQILFPLLPLMFNIVGLAVVLLLVKLSPAFLDNIIWDGRRSPA